MHIKKRASEGGKQTEESREWGTSERRRNEAVIEGEMRRVEGEASDKRKFNRKQEEEK